MARLLLLLLALLPGAAAARAQAPGAPTVLCFGDSLTQGTGASPGESYPDYLRKALAAAGYRVEVSTAGSPGLVTADAVPQLSRALAAHPTVVVLEMGANDAIYGKPTADTERNLRAMIAEVQSAESKLVLAGFDMRPLLPVLPPTAKTPAFLGLFPLHAALAGEYGVPDIPFVLQGVYGVPGLMSQDYIHPNGPGYEKVAQTVLPYVEAALGKPGR